MKISGTDEHGEVTAKIVGWKQNPRQPQIYIKNPVQKRRSPGLGDHLLVKLIKIKNQEYSAEIIRILTQKTKTMLAVFGEDGFIYNTERGDWKGYKVPKTDRLGAKPRELVIAEICKVPKNQSPIAKIIKCLGRGLQLNPYSQIALNEHDIPNAFSDATLQEAKSLSSAPIGTRKDLRHLPLVTIDGDNARDFDDAVFCEPSDRYHKGWHLIIAIADVSWYVRPNSELDISARERGNSVYFPDLVVPMLPKNLSENWCSLKPNEDRPCIAAHIWIDKKGNKVSHSIERSMIRSRARLTYSQVEAAINGMPDKLTKPITKSVIEPLYAAYKSLLIARKKRRPLEIESQETGITLDSIGNVDNISPIKLLESHRLIEEFMILANTTVAEILNNTRFQPLYRVHEPPPDDKFEPFCNFIASLGLNVPKTKPPKTSIFNKLIDLSKKEQYSSAIVDAVLRAQSKAKYSTNNIGHFGLALHKYTHFTSPIRRYSDLIVHRMLTTILTLEDYKNDQSTIWVENLCYHLSKTEKRATDAERDTIDRFTASYLKTKIGEVLDGQISGVIKSGVFVSLKGYVTEGFIPIRSMTNDRFFLNEKQRSLIGRRTKMKLQVGNRIKVCIEHVEPISRTISLKLDYTSNT